MQKIIGLEMLYNNINIFNLSTIMMSPCWDFYVPKIIPAKAPLLQNIKECFSSLIRIQNIVKAAAVIPRN